MEQDDRFSGKYESWFVDQATKSEFFHQKLHEYKLLEIAYAIEDVHGEELDWDRTKLGISESAWNKVIHRGIKPVRVFAHPEVVSRIARSVGYYQKLAMVSLKSMSNVGLSITAYESGRNRRPMERRKTERVCHHLNQLISRLIESDTFLDPREFDLWRGMTAGATAQGSWQNKKGERTEAVIKGFITRRVHELQLSAEQEGNTIRLVDGRVLTYGSEPDIALYNTEGTILAAVEIKGGIDPAGVLERIGAALKSLSRAKQENVQAVTILIVVQASMTKQAVQELAAHQREIDRWLTVEDMLNNDTAREQFFTALGI